jgi:hypothetical protein
MIRKAVNELFEDGEKPAKAQMIKRVKNEFAETENRAVRPSSAVSAARASIAQ